MRLTRIYITAAAVAAIAMFGSYFAIYRYQLGAPIVAEYQLEHWLVVKERAAANTKGSKILLVADSNVLFGFDSVYAQSKLGYPVINMGLHAGLTLNWIMNIAERNAKPGDIVIFPLNLGYYSSDYRIPSTWMMDQYVAWAYRYINYLPYEQRVTYFTSLSPKIMVQNVNVKMNRNVIINANPQRKLLARNDVLANYDKDASAQTTFSYAAKNLSMHGDMRNACGNKYTPHGGMYGVTSETSVRPEVIELLVGSIKRLQQRGIQAYVIAPVFVDDKVTRDSKFQKGLNNIWAQLSNNGIPTIGTPTDYVFPPTDFFDTNYHLNCVAARIRTDVMVSNISKLIQQQ